MGMKSDRLATIINPIHSKNTRVVLHLLTESSCKLFLDNLG